MRTAYRRSPSFNIPGYNQNAVLQLIIASGSGFVMYHLARVTMLVFGFTNNEATSFLLPYVSILSPETTLKHFWTLFTYGWVHTGIMEWISNMVWLYCFGNALQMLVSHKQVIPIYIYGIIGGGIFCVAGRYFFGGEMAVMTAQGGIMALVAAVVTLSPGYRMYLGDNFSIPLVAIAGIYVGLTVVFYPSPDRLMLNAGGLLTGFLVMTAIKRGLRPGAWMYSLSNLSNMTNLRAERAGKKEQKGGPLNKQKRLDEILDKINQLGYNALTQAEKDQLKHLSQDEK